MILAAYSVTVILGVALSLASALGTNAAFLLKHRGAVAAPPVLGLHPLRSAAGLFRSKWFAIGMLVAVAALVLHVIALALAPLSVVQAVLAGGLVFLAVLAEWVFGFHLGRREWIGIGITATGLVFIAITQPRFPNATHVSLAGIIAVESGALLFGVALMIIAHLFRKRLGRAEGMLLGVAAGALFGMADVALKYLTHSLLTRGLIGLVSPWTLSAIIAAILAFYASARSLQIGPGVEVITFTSVAANLTGIGGGILVFGESIGEGALTIVGRVLAFVAVIVGAAVMPAPMRASKHRPS